MPDSARIDAALQTALDGRAVLFLGAGASRLATSATGTHLPSAGELVQQLADDLEIANRSYSLSAIAQHYRKKKGAHRLLSFLQQRLQVTSYPNDLADFLRIRWRRIYTTNYDDLIEKVRPQYPSFVTSDDPSRVKFGSAIHLNGFIQQANIHSLDSDLVLTDWSYAHSELFGSRWLNQFASDIYGASAVIFAGYSLRDLDITRALLRDPMFALKTVIVVADDDDPIESNMLDDYGMVYRTGMPYLFARHKQNKKLPVPDQRPLLDSFHILGVEADPAGTDRSAALFDQFVYGRADEQVLVQPAVPDESLVVSRSDVDNALQRAIEQGYSDILIFGSLGSGKTIAALQLARQLLERRFHVFRVVNKRSSLAEIDDILQYYDDRQICIIFDNYHRYIDEIEHFSSVRRAGDITILTARTSTHDLFESFVERVTAKRYVQVAVDKLTFDEVVQLDELLNFAGLWKEHSGRAPGARVKLAQEKFGSSIPRILLDVVRSSDIRDRVTREIAPILEDKPAARLFVASLIINSMQYEFWVRDWQHFFGVQDLQSTISKHRDALSNFMNLSISHWSTNSGLLSSELLRGVIGNGQIVETLVEIYRVADENKMQDNELNRLRIDLMRFNQIDGLFNEKDKIVALLEYYRRIRKIGETANNSDYWLQYGIVLSIHGNLFDARVLEETELAFENAYRREGAKMQPNTIRIDNYYSRFQLQKAVASQDHALAGRMFLDASQKLIRQVFDEDARHYPFKVGRLYTDIAASHFEHWDQDLRGRFVQRCRDMVRHGEARLSEQDNKDVRLLVLDLTKLLVQIAPSD